MKRSAGFSIFIIVALLWTHPVIGFQWSGKKWPTATTAFDVDIPGANGLWNRAFAEAANGWNAVTAFTFTINANSIADPCSQDGRNGVGFQSDACGVDFGSSTLAITLSLNTTTTPGEKLEADIAFNSNKDWDVFSGPKTSSTNDFRRVAVHELGHAMGLSHEDEVASIMGTFAGNIEVPQQDDINGVNTIYGSGTEPPVGCTNQTPIDIGSSITDTLTSGCTIAQLLGGGDNSSVRQYRINVPIASRLTVSMQSTELDSFLWIYNENLTTLFGLDDDSGGGASGRDALLSVSLEAGDYVILANAFSAGESGVFRLNTSSGSLVASVLPSSRSVQLGDTATAFATIINTGGTSATNCGIEPFSSNAENFSYQTTDRATNALAGAPNTGVDIAAGDFQTFVFSLRPETALSPTNVRLNFNCDNVIGAPVAAGLNTLLLSASDTPSADIVALAATPTTDGIVRLSGANRSNAFSVATANLGATDTITVSADSGSNLTLPVTLSVCQTNTGTGNCLAPPGPSVTSEIAAGATPTFGVFVSATDNIRLDPSTNRIFVRFLDSGELSKGATSVAVTTE